jgi:hypothetical protein
VLAAESELATRHIATRNAQRAVRDAESSLLQAQFTAAGDTVASTKEALSLAKRKLNDTDVIAAGPAEMAALKQDVVNAARAHRNAIRELQYAEMNIVLAVAQAAGDTIGATRATLAITRQKLADALKESGGKENAITKGLRADIIAQQSAERDAVLALGYSKMETAIAYATAAGHTVKAVKLQAAEAHKKLQDAITKAGGKDTAEVQQAKAAAASADAAVRDAVFQDQLGTIDFNLQMERITKSAAIDAMENILKTSKLTRDERRQVLLRIKGLRDEINGDGQWNLGDIRVPTPYEMRRYIKGQLGATGQMRAETYTEPTVNASRDAAVESTRASRRASKNGDSAVVASDNSQTLTIYINGTDVGMVKEVLRKEYGDQVLRTAGTSHGKS